MVDDANPYRAPALAPAAIEPPPAVGQPISVDYENDIDDMVALGYCTQRQSRSMRMQRLRAYVIIVGFLVGLGVLIFVTSDADSLGRFWGLFLILMGILIPISAIFRGRGAARKAYAKVMSEGENRSYFGRKRMVLEPERMCSQSQYIETLVKWPAIEKIAEFDGRAFFFISTLQAFIVPARAFPSDEHFQTFLATAREFQSRAAGATRN